MDTDLDWEDLESLRDTASPTTPTSDDNLKEFLAAFGSNNHDAYRAILVDLIQRLLWELKTASALLQQLDDSCR